MFVSQFPILDQFLIKPERKLHRNWINIPVYKLQKQSTKVKLRHRRAVTYFIPPALPPHFSEIKNLFLLFHFKNRDDILLAPIVWLFLLLPAQRHSGKFEGLWHHLYRFFFVSPLLDKLGHVLFSLFAADFGGSPWILR